MIKLFINLFITQFLKKKSQNEKKNHTALNSNDILPKVCPNQSKGRRNNRIADPPDLHKRIHYKFKIFIFKLFFFILFNFF